VLFTSGDGGWSPFCADIAAHIAASGITVVGIDAKSYLVNFASPQKPITPEELTRDYDARYGRTTGAWTTDMFVEAAYNSLKK